jgi:hypothetical protein
LISFITTLRIKNDNSKQDTPQNEYYQISNPTPLQVYTYRIGPENNELTNYNRVAIDNHLNDDNLPIQILEFEMFCRDDNCFVSIITEDEYEENFLLEILELEEFIDKNESN